MSLLALVGGHAFIDFVTTSEPVRAVARRYLPLAAAAPFVAALPFAYDGIYIGATWTRAQCICPASRSIAATIHATGAQAGACAGR